jgi:HEXXH motif-containing protein
MGGANQHCSSARDNLFLPSAQTVRVVDRTVRERLNSSFSWLGESYSCLRLDPDVLGKWKARPTDFGLYFDLASSVYHAPETAASDQNMAKAQRLAENALSASDAMTAPDRLTIRTLGPDHYDRLEIDCLLRWFDLEPENSMALLPLADTEFEAARAALLRALTFLEDAAPEFYGEFTTLVMEIVFAKPGPAAKLSFGGASSFALWGAMALNARAHSDWWEYLPRLVHEYSHNLLFGIAAEGELVTNDPSERYRSPLRETQRPIDGIYHACYVSAREAIAMDTILIALPEIEMGEEAENIEAYCRTFARNSTEAYQDCRAVLDEHARLTPLGRNVLDDTAGAMAAR